MARNRLKMSVPGRFDPEAPEEYPEILDDSEFGRCPGTLESRVCPVRFSFGRGSLIVHPE